MEPAATPSAAVSITRHETARGGEYQAHVEGSTATGVLHWAARETPRGPVRVVEHTLVPGAIGGRGVAARLVEALVADARAQGFLVHPACSYVAVAFARHPEWTDLRI